MSLSGAFKFAAVTKKNKELMQKKLGIIFKLDGGKNTDGV